MGGGARYPYPKYVWSPAGGWWVNPSNWKSNTFIAFAGGLAVVYAAWNVSANREERTQPPTRWIPSMLWAREFREKDAAKQVQDSS
ncbi:hypothetical protein BDQ12DRAFT_68685 [Crucibulum laeve]|uniref:Uncharacterized protein n=1 Tax=Crucibulum laeve TaxID=68775 RepID=A0A5C3LFM2_9AGAR|nr:hypothetical protein BDQ12DRAFT_68685 [Crucibulum laeve]